MVWGHTVVISQGHLVYTMNRLKNWSFSPAIVPNIHWHQAYTRTQTYTQFTTNGSFLHFRVLAKQNSSASFQELLWWPCFIKPWKTCLNYSAVTSQRGCASYLGTLDTRAWLQWKMEVHEEYEIKISLRTTGLYFFCHGPNSLCPLTEIKGVISWEEELFVHKQPLTNSPEKMLLNSNGWHSSRY